MERWHDKQGRHHSIIIPSSFRHHSIIIPSSFHHYSIIITSLFHAPLCNTVTCSLCTRAQDATAWASAAPGRSCQMTHNGLGKIVDLRLRKNFVRIEACVAFTQITFGILQFLTLFLILAADWNDSVRDGRYGSPWYVGFVIFMTCDFIPWRIVSRTICFPSTELLYLDDNELTGTIPEMFVSQPHLQEIQLYKNQFSGTLPHSIGSLNDLSKCQWHGLVVESVHSLTLQITHSLSNRGPLPGQQQRWRDAPFRIWAIA